MLPAIGLNDEPSFRAGKIDDKWGDHELSAETPPELLVTQQLPESALSIGRVAAQLSRTLTRLFTAAHIAFGVRHC